jgi:hypothetical protein
VLQGMKRVVFRWTPGITRNSRAALVEPKSFGSVALVMNMLLGANQVLHTGGERTAPSLWEQSTAFFTSAA